jgi:hypothetical protein
MHTLFPIFPELHGHSPRAQLTIRETHTVKITNITEQEPATYTDDPTQWPLGVYVSVTQATPPLIVIVHAATGSALSERHVLLLGESVRTKPRKLMQQYRRLDPGATVTIEV